MKIAAFTYAFSHERSSVGLVAMCAEGYGPEMVFAAPWKDLKHKESTVPIRPKALSHMHPVKVCKLLNVPVVVAPHEADVVVDLIKEHGIQMGVILGARILPDYVVESFPRGVLNIHPGAVPENRGQDNIQWAIHDKLPQAVTAHFVGRKIDCGRVVMERIVDVYACDSIIDIYYRLKTIERDVIVDALHSVFSGNYGRLCGNMGKYHSYYDGDKDELMDDFLKYRACYKDIVEKYREYKSKCPEWKDGDI